MLVHKVHSLQKLTYVNYITEIVRYLFVTEFTIFFPKKIIFVVHNETPTTTENSLKKCVLRVKTFTSVSVPCLHLFHN